MVVKSDGLKTKDLYKTIHKASKLKAEKYNKRKWRYMQKQLKKSKKILYSNAATQKSINSAKLELKRVWQKESSYMQLKLMIMNENESRLLIKIWKRTRLQYVFVI